MLALSRKVDYALIVTSELARQNGNYMSSSDIAKKHGISAKFMDRVLSLLKNGKVVISHEGKLGGYKLSKAANKISVLEIVKAVEGPLISPNCAKTGKCFGKGCNHKIVWTKARESLEKTFESYSLSDLI
ncbi:MAG: hypothetical protein A3D24_04700 [Candidatus Blackburnbacteria bacterium RIFCSPHIGHO2_02_FULL_39_13]|uniref:Rrf2 family transcriptional regulator n=1 Tax=Candidatus Blackburnbacteria bacterium RIFCSPLOWO2_01_FULL_40_20 TaxID=1797519 RepID=A0A1G1VBD7_9BACT|nr:MAG: Transcriptional regulator, Rrf2 family [Microgenomates group bacterium GW2011_GWA2_39_19]OGY07089.1 MAG: hypothetical protein A2694_03370 [Candidatus Blackburnbacteria bacterium RIFCSPHIGHO2_01_FULL_40_17]OGY08911.1 MAG: hypothetical protein A3D24_04700 [Candidatus Blackburnbacteria bacterium RIFCSPHIGHO2_02_FULL_39_13]OGY12743.1 MAG: hypothetical protein A3A77_00445 [Candidatus Blackburnbacteria bacterium RIFCSPLOWO2_01_FULL_40_20]OGY15276.1 MAG: hypothetical protein A3I52_01055 [Candi